MWTDVTINAPVHRSSVTVYRVIDPVNEVCMVAKYLVAVFCKGVHADRLVKTARWFRGAFPGYVMDSQGR